MKSIIEKTIAALMIVCAASSAWATPYETKGYEDFGSTAGVVLWRATQTTFHNSTVIDVAADGTLGTAYAMTADNTATSWQRFASGQSAYESPGKVLVYDTAGSYTRQSNATFYPISFGGMWVKSLASDGGPFTISGTGTRTTQFGADNKDTYFKFDKSFTINRQGTVTFKGKATVDIATDATFWAQYYSGQTVSVPSGAELVLTGGGTYASQGTTVAGTLNISAATRPTISGNVTLSAGSTLALPAGTAKNETVSIAVCSGTLTVDGAVNVKIGTDDAVSGELIVSGGTIIKILTARTYTATVSGATNFSAISWTQSGVASDAVWGVTASADVTVSAPSTITIDSATNMATLKLLGSADLTIATSSQLTLAALDLSEYTGSVTVSGTAFTLANGGLTGSATFILDPGAGNTYTMSQSNTGYTGEAVIKSGTVKMGNATSFGAMGRSSSIRVKEGAKLDTNGASNSEYNKHKNKVILEEGATFTSTVANGANFQNVPCTSITLEGDAVVDASTVDVGLAQFYHYNSVYLNIGTYTLQKKGSYDFRLSAIDNIVGSGVIDVQEGTFSVCDSAYDNHHASLNDGTLKVAAGATFKLAYNGYCYPDFTVKNIELSGTVARDDDSSPLTVNGYISGTGTTPMLTLASGATLKPKSSTGCLTVTESLTLSGTLNIDLSEVNLSSKADGTYFAILTAPADGEFNLANVTLDRGGNGSGWVLYSRETAADSGIYELGVYLTPDVTWRGASGTWTDTSFNGGSGNYTTGQQVVFSDNGASTDALAVTVDGAKNVSALDFTADNRNVTLSGDAITAGTVSKSGDGVATVNSALSVTTSIAVSDGVLVVNPTAAVVSDEWTASDNGTLVVYVDSGVTTTISAAITANKLVKRGAGTLVLSAANTISGSITVSEGTLKASTNVGCFGGESIPVYVEDGAAVDMNNVRFLNRVYIIGDGPDGNGAYINTGDNNGRSGGMQGNIANKLTLTGDASIGGTATIHFASSSSVDIGTYTLTKKGVFWLPLAGTTISGTGKIVIEEGDFSNNSGANNLDGIDLEITGGTLDMAGGTSMSVKNFKSATAITANATASSSAKLIVNGKIDANGTLTIPNLQLNDGAAIELATTASKVAVSGAFTFASGTVTCQFADGVTPGNATFLDLSALNLGSAPAGSFALSSALAAEYLPSKTAAGFSITKGYASITASGVTTPYADALTLAMNLPEAYDYITVLGTGNVSLYWIDGIKIKNPNSATLAFIGLKDDCVALPSTVDDITTYTKAATPTIYTWTGAAKYTDQFDEDYNQLPDPRFTTLANWSFVNSSSQTDMASRVPSAGDTLVFNAGANVEIPSSASATFAAVNIGGAGVAWTRYGDSGTVTISATGGIVLTTAASSLAVDSNITITPGNVTTSVEGKGAKWVTSDGTTTYTVADPAASIGAVQYGSLANAIECASDNDTITLTANCAESVNLGGKTITFSESSSTFTGSFSGSGTLILTALLKSASTDRWQSTWSGTVWLKNISYSASDLGLEKYGNSTSYLKLSNVAGYLAESSASFPMISVELDNDNVVDGFGLKLNNGFGRTSDARLVTIKKLTGSGTLYGSDSAKGVTILVKDWADFTGTLTLKNKVVAFGSSVPSNALFGKGDSYNSGNGGFVYVCSGATLTIPADANWETAYGYVVDGTLINNSTSLTGSGTALTFDGSGSVTQNATGTSSEGVTIKGYVAATINGASAKFGTGNITLAGSSTLTYDPGVGNTYTMNSHIAAATTSNKVIVKSGVLKPNSGAGANGAFSQAEIEIQDGAELLLDYSTDVTGYNDCGAPIRIKSGGILNVGKRETMAHDLYFEGGTLKITGTQGGRGLDLFSSRCDIVVTENSQILATGDYPVYLRDGDVTMNIAEGKTLACNCAIIYHSAADNTDANSKSNLIKQGSGALVLNGYNGGAFALPKGLNITAGVVEVNTVLNSNGQTGDAANVYTVASGAKLKVGSAGQVNTATLTLNNGSLLEFGAGNATLINTTTASHASGTVQVSFSAGVTPTDGTKLLAWSSAPDGTFTIADDDIAADYRLVKDSEGLKVAAIVKISNTSSAEVGYIDENGAALITNTVGTIVVPMTTAIANVYPNSTATFTLSEATSLSDYNIYIKYLDANEELQTQSIKFLFSPTILAAGEYQFTLNPSGNASVNAEPITLQPELRAGNSDPAPMAYDAETGNPKFNIKSIPGLYYAVKAYSSPDCEEKDRVGTGVATQANSATVSPEAPAIGASTVQYYKISVGFTATEAQQ